MSCQPYRAITGGETETDRQAARQADRQTITDKQAGGQTNNSRQAGRPTNKTSRLAVRPTITDRQAGRPTHNYKQASWQTDRKTDKQAGRERERREGGEDGAVV